LPDQADKGSTWSITVALTRAPWLEGLRLGVKAGLRAHEATRPTYRCGTALASHQIFPATSPRLFNCRRQCSSWL